MIHHKVALALLLAKAIYCELFSLFMRINELNVLIWLLEFGT